MTKAKDYFDSKINVNLAISKFTRNLGAIFGLIFLINQNVAFGKLCAIFVIVSVIATFYVQRICNQMMAEMKGYKNEENK